MKTDETYDVIGAGSTLTSRPNYSASNAPNETLSCDRALERPLSRRKFIIAAGAAALTAAFRAGATAGTKRRIRVGLMPSSSGAWEAESHSLVTGFKLGLKNNVASKLPLEVIEAPVGEDEAELLNILTDLVLNKEVNFLIAPMSLTASEHTLHAVKERNVIVFITNPTVGLVAGELCIPGCFRVGPNTYQSSYPLAPWVLKNMGRKLFLTGSDNLRSNQEADFFAYGFERSGGRFFDRLMTPENAPPSDEVFKRIEAIQPDSIFAAFRDERAAEFLAAVREHAPEYALKLVGPESLTRYPLSFPPPGKNPVRARTLTSLQTPLELMKAIEKTMGVRITHASRAAEGMDIATVICTAIDKTDADLGDKQRIIQLIEQTEFPGAHGILRFDPNHEPIVHMWVNDWSMAGGAVDERITADLGLYESPDFGCGRVGFPPPPERGPIETEEPAGDADTGVEE